VQARAALHVLDGLGNALAARRLGTAPFSTAANGLFGAGSEASVIGDRRHSSAASAALANGILIHALDYDDTHTLGIVHATAATLPAALAAGEQGHVDGRDFLTALVAGYELVSRLGAASPHGFHARGFHATGICGAYSAALVAAKLGGLRRGQAVNALGIAGSQSSGSLEFLATGAATKQVHPGWAAVAGLVSAALAEGGASGPSTTFEGERGLYAIYTDAEPDLSAICASLGSSWQIEGIAVKPYPACHLLHRTLDAGREVRNETDPDGIAEIIVRVPAESIPIVAAPGEVKRSPRTPYEAKFSVQWSLAAMLCDGRVDVDTYRPERLGRPELLTISHMVRVEERPSTDRPRMRPATLR
jgi:2-methylcitrate dehydratase PrpD